MPNDNDKKPKKPANVDSVPLSNQQRPESDKKAKKKELESLFPQQMSATSAVGQFLAPQAKTNIMAKFADLTGGELQPKSIKSRTVLVGLLSKSPATPRAELTVSNDTVSLTIAEPGEQQGPVTDEQINAYAKQVVDVFLAGHGIMDATKATKEQLSKIKAEVFGTPKVRAAIYKAFQNAGVLDQNLSYKSMTPEVKGGPRIEKSSAKQEPGMRIGDPVSGQPTQPEAKSTSTAGVRLKNTTKTNTKKFGRDVSVKPAPEKSGPGVTVGGDHKPSGPSSK